MNLFLTGTPQPLFLSFKLLYALCKLFRRVATDSIYVPQGLGSWPENPDSIRWPHVFATEPRVTLFPLQAPNISTTKDVREQSPLKEKPR